MNAPLQPDEVRAVVIQADDPVLERRAIAYEELHRLAFSAMGKARNDAGLHRCVAIGVEGKGA